MMKLLAGVYYDDVTSTNNTNTNNTSSTTSSGSGSGGPAPGSSSDLDLASRQQQQRLECDAAIGSITITSERLRSGVQFSKVSRSESCTQGHLVIVTCPCGVHGRGRT